MENKEPLLKSITILKIGRGCDSLPRNGEKKTSEVSLLSRKPTAWTYFFFLIVELVFMSYSDTSSSQSQNSFLLVPDQ